jgi:hypothetical protein
MMDNTLPEDQVNKWVLVEAKKYGGETLDTKYLTVPAYAQTGFLVEGSNPVMTLVLAIAGCMRVISWICGGTQSIQVLL